MDAGADRARRVGILRMAKVETALALSATARSARTLTDAADAALAVAAHEPDARAVAALAEALMQRAAVQDLLVVEHGVVVDLGDRLGALSVGLVDGTSRLAEIRASAPRLKVDARTARWLTGLIVELIEGVGADLPVGEGRVTVDVEIRDGLVIIAVTGDPVDRARPSLRLDGGRSVAASMGGRLRERVDLPFHSVEVIVPLFHARASRHRVGRPRPRTD